MLAAHPNEYGRNVATRLCQFEGLVDKGFDRSMPPTAGVQPLHGLTFALLHLACMRILVIITPIELAATAQAIYAFGIGATSALLTLAFGFLYAGLGSTGFLVMAALALASLPTIWALSRSLDETRP
jgi:PPP family 3-phenylpropionic acid transporter